MRIIVKGGNHPEINLLLPTGLMANRLTAGIIPSVLEPYGIRVTKAQALAFLNVLKRCRHDLKDWVLVEVHSAHGEEILIKL